MAAPTRRSWDYWIDYAEDQIAADYDDVVSVRQKAKQLTKFGKNGSLGTSYETVWLRGGDETYATTNAIDKISSSDNSDTQSVVVEGHTIDGSGNLTFHTQTVTLVGQTETALTTPLARATRLYNNGTVDFAGTVYVYEDDTVAAGVPQTSAKIHLQTEGAGAGSTNQSEKAATSISQFDYWIITQIGAFVDEKTTAACDFQLQWRTVGTTNKVFTEKLPFNATSNGSSYVQDFRPFLIVPKNSDFRIRAVASTTNVSVEAFAHGPLAIIDHSL